MTFDGLAQAEASGSATVALLKKPTKSEGESMKKHTTKTDLVPTDVSACSTVAGGSCQECLPDRGGKSPLAR